MSNVPKHARYGWGPMSVGAGLFLASCLICSGLGNEHGASRTPGVDTMPYFPVEIPTTAAASPANLPPQAKRVAALVCQGFVFVDTKHHEVIVNPVVDPEAQRPLHLVDVDRNGATFAQPQPRDNFTLYRWVGGKLINDGDGRLTSNRCYPDTVVSTTQVHDAKGIDRYILTDFGSTVHAGDKVDQSASTAVHEGIVHADFAMTDGQIEDFVDKLD